MKIHSIQVQFLATVLSAMLAISVFVGGMSVYEVDKVLQTQTEASIDAMCEKETARFNGIFSDMEKSVRIMENYVLALVESGGGVPDRDGQAEILEYADRLFAYVAKQTDNAAAYYLRFAPEISDNQTGLFYSKVYGGQEYIRLAPTDLSLYDPDDVEHVGWFWQPYKAGEPIWMQPYHNQNNGLLMISYVVPLYYEGQFLGVVGMDFDYTILTDRVHEIEIYEHGFAHLETEDRVMHYRDGTLTQDNCDESDQYLQVSRELVNGMRLVLSADYNDIRQARYAIDIKLLLVVAALTVLFSVIVIFTVRKTVKPLEKLTEASQKLSNGNYDVEIAHSDLYEIDRLSSAFETMTQHLREYERQQHYLAYRDSLTGLRNTTSYKAWSARFDEKIQTQQMDFGVIVFDVNNLKVVNDQYGHETGNKLIVAAARVISDTFKHSPVFRIGGDEFVAILQNSDLENKEELLLTFEAECANASVETEGSDIFVSIANGVAMYDPERDGRFADVFHRADDAMYENKRRMKAEQV